MRRSIVPAGFESCSHSIFRNYSNPLLPPINFGDNEVDDNLEKEKCEHNNTCPICLQDALDPVTLVSCHHCFCIECIVKWFQTKLACPLCKTSCSFFIQSNLGSRGRLNLWKTAPNMNENEIKHIPDASLSSIPGLQMAIRAHRSNILRKNHVIPLNYPNNYARSSIMTSTDISEDLVTSSHIMIKRPDTLLPDLEDMNGSISLSDDLETICAELLRLEEELKADYDTEHNKS